tara:strand:+ start:1274 stop:1474 length:201 start_codon:yes stop_codon:yes gene_type:complete
MNNIIYNACIMHVCVRLLYEATTVCSVRGREEEDERKGKRSGKGRGAEREEERKGNETRRVRGEMR